MKMLVVFAFAMLFASAAMASGAAPGHHLHHDEFYSKLKRPGTDKSCCDNRDCRPVRHRVTADGVEFFVHSQWRLMPRTRTLEVPTPDGKAHWCGTRVEGPGIVPITYCAIVPFRTN